MEGCFWKRSPIFEAGFFSALIFSFLVCFWISFTERSGVGMQGGFQAWMHRGERGGWQRSETGRACLLWCPRCGWVPWQCPVAVAVQADPVQRGFSSGLTYSKGEHKEALFEMPYFNMVMCRGYIGSNSRQPWFSWRAVPFRAPVHVRALILVTALEQLQGWAPWADWLCQCKAVFIEHHSLVTLQGNGTALKSCLMLL